MIAQTGITARYKTVEFKAWTKGRSIEAIGTNAGMEALAFQRWRSFKEAFAPEIVERAVSETPGTVKHILDPCGGSGTTGLAAQFLGLRPTLIEVNPYLADLIEAKLATYDFDELAAEFRKLCRIVNARQGRPASPFRNAPATFVEPGVKGQFIFSREVAERIYVYRKGIEQLTSPAVKKLFRVLLGSILVPVSNVVISGKGRRYRSSWQARMVPFTRVDELFMQRVLDAIFDLRLYDARACKEFTVIRGDSRKLTRTIEPIDLAVFSPPYPNSFDYTDVYNLELWTLGYLQRSSDNTALRNATVRSHVQIKRDMTGHRYASVTLKRTLKALEDVRSTLWNKQIPEMISAYISDMGDIMTALGLRLRKAGRVYMVVGDSRYGGVNIPVAKILCQIAHQAGLAVITSEPSRSMRSSPQQGGREELPETLLVFAKI